MSGDGMVARCVARSVTFGNGGCSGKVAGGAAYELRTTQHIDALAGLPCSVGQSLATHQRIALLAAVSLPYTPLLLRFRQPSAAEYCDERVCLSLCVFVCPRSYLRNYTSDLHQSFDAC